MFFDKAFLLQDLILLKFKKSQIAVSNQFHAALYNEERKKNWMGNNV